MTSALATINASWSGPARGMAFALYGATFAAAVALGPMLGAVVAEAADWRFAFWINLVLGPIAYAGVTRFVPAVAPRAEARRPDVAGTALVSAALTALTFAVVQAGTYGWLSAKRDVDLLGIAFPEGGISPTPVALGIAAALFAAFAGVQRSRIARDLPVIADPALTRVRSFTLGSAALPDHRHGRVRPGVPAAARAAGGPRPDADRGGPAGAGDAGRRDRRLPAGADADAAQRRTDRRARGPAAGGGRPGRHRASRSRASRCCGSSPAWRSTASAIGGATAQLSMLVLADVPGRRAAASHPGISTAVRQLGSSLGVALLGLLFSGVVGRTSGTLADQPVQTMAEHRATGDAALVSRAADALADGVALAGIAAAAILVIGALAVRALPRGEAAGAGQHQDAGEAAYAWPLPHAAGRPRRTPFPATMQVRPPCSHAMTRSPPERGARRRGSRRSRATGTPLGTSSGAPSTIV